MIRALVITVLLLVLVLAVQNISFNMSAPHYKINYTKPAGNRTYNHSTISGKCSTDSDCVPAQCCHPTSCTTKSMRPDCSGVFCTENCAPDTLDCGQGSCKCVEGKCVAIINGD